jgi:hypothetical protein
MIEMPGERRAPITARPAAGNRRTDPALPGIPRAIRLDLGRLLPNSGGTEVNMIKRADPWNARSAINRWAHVLERTGLALTGAACGLFVAAHVARADIDLIGSAVTVFAMMLYGAAGFYLGIDLPPAPADHRMHLPLGRGLGTRADAVELLSAAGTFLAAVAAVISVSSIVLDETAHAGTALLISIGWAIGTTMQIAAGIIVRTRRDDSAAA